jgi:hypothetical protein
VIDHPAIPTVPPEGLGTTAEVTQASIDRPVTDEPVACPDCGRTVAWKATRPYRIQCRHCRVDVER